jgi:hypothetical protein
MFNVFVDDLSALLSKSYVGCYINDVCINHLFYADDAVLLAPLPYALQILLNICQDFASLNEMVYNVKKTVCMHMLPKKLNLYVPNMYLNGRILTWVCEQKYLGIYMTSNFSYERDIEQQICPKLTD